MRLRDKDIIVTGNTTGIGRAFAGKERAWAQFPVCGRNPAKI